MVSLAGIFANLTTAVFALALIKTFQATGVFPAPADSIAEPLGRLLLNGLFINASLAVFNLLPFPPLDGSKVLETFLPASFQPLLQVLEQYGFMILILLMYTGFFRLIFEPVQAFLGFLVRL
jgi:Zn-dependent protease